MGKTLTLDLDFADHPQMEIAIAKGGRGAFLLWIRAACFSERFQTAGFVCSETIQRLAQGPTGKREHAALIAAGLWARVPGGIEIQNVELAGLASPHLEAHASRVVAIETPEERDRRQARERQAKKRAAEKGKGVTADCVTGGVFGRDIVTAQTVTDRDSVTPCPLGLSGFSSSEEEISPPESQKTTRVREAVTGGVTADPASNVTPITRDAPAGVARMNRTHEVLSKAYARGITKAALEVSRDQVTPFLPPESIHDLRILEKKTEAVKGSAKTMEAEAWVEESAYKYRKATHDSAQFQSGFSPAYWQKWLDAGQPAPGKPRGSAPLQNEPTEEMRERWAKAPVERGSGMDRTGRGAS